MPLPYNNVRSKLNRAIVAYLLTQGCGGVNDILPWTSGKTRPYPNITVHSVIAKPQPNYTGSYAVTVHISIKGSASQPTTEPNPEVSRIAFEQRVGGTFDALMMTDDEQTLRFTAAAITAAGRALAVDPSNGTNAAQALSAQNNADMVDFTCQHWIDQGTGDGQASDEGCAWEEILIFEALACSANVD